MSLLSDDTKKFSKSNIFFKLTLENIFKWLNEKTWFKFQQWKILTTMINKPFDQIDLLINHTKIPEDYKAALIKLGL